MQFEKEKKKLPYETNNWGTRANRVIKLLMDDRLKEGKEERLLKRIQHGILLIIFPLFLSLFFFPFSQTEDSYISRCVVL